VVRWLEERGLEARTIATRYEGERDDVAVDAADMPDAAHMADDSGAADAIGVDAADAPARNP
jgi:hypothetical protein